MSRKITTIIPTFQRSKLLQRAIESVIEQDEKSINICVYDNASSDETESIVANYAKNDDRIIYYRHDENIGGLANFLYGMSQVQTPYFSFLSDDDYLLPEFYTRALSRLEENTQAAFWVGMTINVDESGVIWDVKGANWENEGLIDPPDGFFHFAGTNTPAWTSILFRTDLISRYGLIDTSLLGPTDLEYCLRLSALSACYFEKHPAAVFTLNSQSFSATQPLSAFWPGWVKMIEKFNTSQYLTKENQNKTSKALLRNLERMLFRRGANALALHRLDFAKDSVTLLAKDCNANLKSLILRFFLLGCSNSTIFQNIYAASYKRAEKTIIKTRGGFQKDFGHLIK